MSRSILTTDTMRSFLFVKQVSEQMLTLRIMKCLPGNSPILSLLPSSPLLKQNVSTRPHLSIHTHCLTDFSFFNFYLMNAFLHRHIFRNAVVLSPIPPPSFHPISLSLSHLLPHYGSFLRRNFMVPLETVKCLGSIQENYLLLFQLS